MAAISGPATTNSDACVAQQDLPPDGIDVWVRREKRWGRMDVVWVKKDGVGQVQEQQWMYYL